MKSPKQQLQDNLNKVAYIVRKYNIGDRKYYFEKFSSIDKKLVETGWAYGQTIIQNREIVKDASEITETENQVATNKFLELKRDTESLYFYLNKVFDPKKLKLTDENVERRIRHKAAVLYIGFINTKIIELEKQVKPTVGQRLKNSVYKLRTPLIIAGVVGLFFTPRIIDGLTTVEKLAEKIHEKSKRKFNGAVCNDGKISHSQGRGTCSWHGGVDYYFYKGEYTKTWEECIEEAKKRSWRD